MATLQQHSTFVEQLLAGICYQHGQTICFAPMSSHDFRKLVVSAGRAENRYGLQLCFIAPCAKHAVAVNGNAILR